MRIHLSYADQNEEFGCAFPIDGLDGTAVRRLALKDWGDDWHHVDLEGTFEYKARRHDRVWVRSRWVGKNLGDDTMTPVFILLVRDTTALERPIGDSNDFDHAAWGMVTTVPEQPPT